MVDGAVVWNVKLGKFDLGTAHMVVRGEVFADTATESAAFAKPAKGTASENSRARPVGEGWPIRLGCRVDGP